MALFSNLHHVGEVIVQIITDNLDSAPTGQIQVGPPLDNPTGTAEDIRVTLLWVTPQPTHRNDPRESNGAGGMLQAPLTITATYMVTTYGSASDDPVRAQELLGNVMQAFHTVPSVNLPLPTLPGAGEGRLTFTQVPTTLEMTERIFIPLQIKLRSWVMFEVGPVQLPKRTPVEPPAAMVRPGGIHLGPVTPLAQPELVRLTPAQQGVGGIVRLDVETNGRALTEINLDTAIVPAASLTVITPGKSYLLTLPSTVGAGRAVPVRLRVGDRLTDPPEQFSPPQQLPVLATTSPTLDAPPAYTIGDALTLVGRALTGAQQLLIWPDGPLTEPTEVRTLVIPAGAVTPTSVEITAAAMASANLKPGFFRAAISFASGLLTPFVVLEARP